MGSLCTLFKLVFLPWKLKKQQQTNRKLPSLFFCKVAVRPSYCLCRTTTLVRCEQFGLKLWCKHALPQQPKDRFGREFKMVRQYHCWTDPISSLIILCTYLAPSVFKCSIPLSSLQQPYRVNQYEDPPIADGGGVGDWDRLACLRSPGEVMAEVKFNPGTSWFTALSRHQLSR